MNRRHLWILAVLAVLIAVPLLSACGGTPGPSQPKGKAGGKLILASSADKFNLDPGTTTWNSDIMYHLNIYEVLYRVNRDGTALLPSAATDYKISADGKAWTFHLKKGLKFSDGTLIKSEDWKYSVQRARDPAAVDAWAWEATGLTTMDTPDDYTIVFNLDKPFVPFLSYVAGYWAEVFPKAALEAKGDKFWDMPVCSGPFMVKEIVQSDHLTLVPNPHAAIKALLSEVKITSVPDDNTRVLQLQSGDVDVIINTPYSMIDSINALPDRIVQAYPFAFNQVMYINHSKPPMDDLNFRTALTYATDRPALIKAVAFGHTIEWNTVAPKGVMYYNPDQVGFPYDLEKAKQYLAKSKYASGAEMVLITSSASVVNVSVSTALQAMWQKLPGVKVTVQQFEPAVMRATRDKGEFNAFAGGFSSDVIDPDEILGWFMTGYVQETWCHADVSALKPMVEQARVETDPKKRQDLYYQIQKWEHENVYTIGLWYQNNDWGMKKSVQGFWVDPIVGIWLWETWIQ